MLQLCDCVALTAIAKPIVLLLNQQTKWLALSHKTFHFTLGGETSEKGHPDHKRVNITSFIGPTIQGCIQIDLVITYGDQSVQGGPVFTAVQYWKVRFS